MRIRQIAKQERVDYAEYAVDAPMPIANVAIAMMVKTGDRRNPRIAYRTSCNRPSSQERMCIARSSSKVVSRLPNCFFAKSRPSAAGRPCVWFHSAAHIQMAFNFLPPLLAAR
jgi:hypothetical protein